MKAKSRSTILQAHHIQIGYTYDVSTNKQDKDGDTISMWKTAKCLFDKM